MSASATQGGHNYNQLQPHINLLIVGFKRIALHVAQRDGRLAEYRWLRRFRNSIPCTMPQSLADVHCSSAVQ